MRIAIFLYFLFIKVTLSQEAPSDDVKKIEKKWDFDTYSKPKRKDYYKKNPMNQPESEFTVEEKFSSEPTPIFLSPFAPEKQEMFIDPDIENMFLGNAGTKIIFPPNCFILPSNYRKGEPITIQVQEALSSLDFITAGVSLSYYDSNKKPYLFESSGMFRLSANFYGKPVYKKRDCRIKAEFPVSSSNLKGVNLYKLEERGWTDKGQANYDEINVPRDSPEYLKMLTGVIPNVDSFTWWNFDKPNPDTTCLQGAISAGEGVKSPFTITITGIDFKYASTQNANGNDFKINALQSKLVKLIAMDSRGNIGVSREIKTDSSYAFINSQNYKSTSCQDIGKIEIKKIEPSIRQDKQKLINFLGLKD